MTDGMTSLPGHGDNVARGASNVDVSPAVLAEPRSVSPAQRERPATQSKALRVTLFVDRFPSLSETFIITHVAGLLERGHDVRVISRLPPAEAVDHAAVARYGMVERTTYLDSHQRSRLRCAVRGMGLALRRGWQKPNTVCRALNVFKYGRPALSLRLLGDGMACDVGPCDIIHCHFGPNASWAARLRQIGALRGRLVVTFHGYDMSVYLKRHGQDVYQQLFAQGDLFLPISERWRDRLIELGCPPERTRVHRMGIDCSRFTYRDPRPPQGPVKLLMVGRLVQKKGTAYAIRAVANLLKRGYPLEFALVGDGPRRQQLSRLIDELGVGEHVHMLGAQTQEQITHHLQTADLFMAPSVTSDTGDQEGVPVAIMEAMAVGLPVLSTWHSGIPELVDDGVTGLLAPERDADALTERLQQLLDHPDCWPAMARAGRAKVESAFDLNKLNDQLIELYRSLVREPR